MTTAGSSALPAVLRGYPGIALALSPEGSIEASNGRLETVEGGAVCGRRFADLLDPGSAAKWHALIEGGGAAAAFIELVRKGAGDDTLHAFTAIARDGPAGWWLIEHPAEARGTAVFEEMSALNAELSQAHRELARERERLARALDSEAQARAQAQTALAQRDEVLGVVAHDLRNPLNVISMAAKQIRLQAAAPPDERLLDILDRVVRNMDRLIGDLLEVRRIDAGRLHLDLSAFEVPELVQQIWEEMAPLAERRSVRLERSCEALPPLRADRGRVLQALFNLIDNAIRVTPAGQMVRLAAAADADGVQFTVTDAGPGIPADELPHIFDRFWQGKGGGSAGLGLAIVKGIVEAHGGRVEVEATPDRGSRFRIRIPAAR